MAGRINIPPRHSSEVVPSLHTPGARFAQMSRTDREAVKEYAGTRQILPVEQVLHESTNSQPRAGNAVPGKLRVDQLVTRQLLAILAAEIVREEEIAVEHQIAIRRMERQRPANRGRTREAWRILVDVGSIKHHTSGQGRRQRNAVDLNLRVRSIERRGEVTGRAHARLEFDTINRLVGDVRTKGRVGWRIRSRSEEHTSELQSLKRNTDA